MSKKGNRIDVNERNEGTPRMCLSAEDQRHLVKLEQKFQLVRDRTEGVVTGSATGMYLHGDGGVGKSFTVLETLQRLKAHFVVFNSRMTGRGLYNQLEKYPDATHVLEDLEPLTRDRGAQGVLRSALWGQRRDGDRGPMERLVTWTTYRMEHSFIFSGGIILIGNRPLADLPELNAVRTRISVVHLQASDPELRALMRKVALKGFEHEGRELPPSECLEVCEFIIEQSMALHWQLNMRALVNSFQDRLQWEENESGCHWRDLVASRLRERPTWFREEVVVSGRAARKAAEQQIASEIKDLPREERARAWRERTGKSEPALYRRLRELEQSDSHKVRSDNAPVGKSR